MSIKLFIKQIFAQYLMVNVHKLLVIHNVVSSNTVFKKTDHYLHVLSTVFIEQ